VSRAQNSYFFIAASRSETGSINVHNVLLVVFILVEDRGGSRPKYLGPGPSPFLLLFSSLVFSPLPSSACLPFEMGPLNPARWSVGVL